MDTLSLRARDELKGLSREAKEHLQDIFRNQLQVMKFEIDAHGNKKLRIVIDDIIEAC